MTEEPVYEYRIEDSEGRTFGFITRGSMGELGVSILVESLSEEALDDHRRRTDEKSPRLAPHCLQRRSIGPWLDFVIAELPALVVPDLPERKDAK